MSLTWQHQGPQHVLHGYEMDPSSLKIFPAGIRSKKIRNVSSSDGLSHWPLNGIRLLGLGTDLAFCSRTMQEIDSGFGPRTPSGLSLLTAQRTKHQGRSPSCGTCTSFSSVAILSFLLQEPTMWQRTGLVRCVSLSIDLLSFRYVST